MPLAIAQRREVPKFEVDPNWPQLPAKWVWGQVSSVSIDERQHAWVLQRPKTIRTDQKGRAAPAVIEFDEAGKFVQGWGGPGEGYDWPEPASRECGLRHIVGVAEEPFLTLGSARLQQR